MDHSSRPIPARAPKAAISAYAEDVARELGLKPGDPLEPIVAALGGCIEYKTARWSAARLPESIVVRSEKDFTIYLGTMASPERDRFTVAHELGHFFVHYPLAAASEPGVPMIATRWVDDGDEQQKRAEWEANWFAAAFLMPGDTFRKAAELLSTEGLASKFFVSLSAAEIRKKSLGLQ